MRWDRFRALTVLWPYSTICSEFAKWMLLLWLLWFFRSFSEQSNWSVPCWSIFNGELVFVGVDFYPGDSYFYGSSELGVFLSVPDPWWFTVNLLAELYLNWDGEPDSNLFIFCRIKNGFDYWDFALFGIPIF